MQTVKVRGYERKVSKKSGKINKVLLDYDRKRVVYYAGSEKREFKLTPADRQIIDAMLSTGQLKLENVIVSDYGIATEEGIKEDKYYIVNFVYRRWDTGRHNFIQIVCDSAGNILEFETEKKARKFLNKLGLHYTIMRGSKVIKHRIKDVKCKSSGDIAPWKVPEKFIKI